MNEFDWAAIWYAVPYMLQGTLITLEISICAMALASLVGIVMGLISASNMLVPKAVIRAYVYFVRGTPALVQIFWCISRSPASVWSSHRSGVG